MIETFFDEFIGNWGICILYGAENKAGEKYCVKTQPERLNGVVFDGIVLSHKTV